MAVGFTVELIGAPVASTADNAATQKVRADAVTDTAGGQNVIRVEVDWRDDEGTRLRQAGLLDGPMPIRTAESSNIAGDPPACLPDDVDPGDPDLGGACTFAVDCIDNDPCTFDACAIAPGCPFDSGRCLNDPVPDGEAGGCSDGVFCNGLEFCSEGSCTSGPSITCCDSTAENGVGPQVCMEGFGVCSPESVNAGAPCESSTECREGACDRCRNDCRERRCNDGETLCSADGDCPSVTGRCSNAPTACVDDTECPGGTCGDVAVCLTNDEVCSDGRACNGTETCDMSTGACIAGENPCGLGAQCSEKRCSGGLNPGCNVDEDCNNGTCTLAGPGCFFGRCCSVAADPECGFARLASCAGNWYASDDGFHSGGFNTCGGESPSLPQTEMGCPKYSAGISQTTGSGNPARLVDISPIMSSDVAVEIGSHNGPLQRVGDDYSVINGSHLAIDAIRFVGGVVNPNRLSIEFYDNDSPPNFVEDIVLPPIANTDINIVVVEFNPRLTIPPAGWVVLRAAENFAPNTQARWMSTDAVQVEGAPGNDPNMLWLNDGPAANFLPDSAPGILALEIVGGKVDPPEGACCLPGGDCDNLTNWVCAGNDGNFQEGLPCSQCVNGDNFGAPCRTCQGGSEVGDPCTANADCTLGGTCQPDDTVCNAGQGTCSNDNEGLCDDSGDCTGIVNRCSNSGDFCLNDAECDGGTCGGAGTCLAGTCQSPGCGTGACCDDVTGDCTEGETDLSCSGTFQGFGSSCDPDCCPQPAVTGADQPGDATVHVINVPPPGSDPVTVTITGNNSGATSDPETPDTCFGTLDTIFDDPGWWEAFSIDDCAHVRLDFCCTQPIREPAWAFLAADPNCDSTLGNTAPPKFGENENERGAPYCAEDNLWQWYAFLQPGTYYYPVYAVLAGQPGPYQMHITVEPCEYSACCLPNGECADGNTDPPGLTQLDCDALGGFFLAQPQRAGSVPICAATAPGADGNPCNTGSCCVAPGVCADARDNNGVAMDRLTCEGGAFTGTFVPNIQCAGGRCSVDTHLSCDNNADCGVGQTCTGDPQDIGQPNPCPICEHLAVSTCQVNPAAWTGFIRISDESSNISPITVTDDVLISTTGDLEKVCVIGTYAIQTPGVAGLAPCTGTDIPPDSFTVRVYAGPEGNDPNAAYVPGELLGEWKANEGEPVLAENPEQPEFVTADFEFYRHQITLDPSLGDNTPLVQLEADNVYFIEVYNNTVSPPGEPDCNWWWIDAEEGEGNGLLYQDQGDILDDVDADENDVSICLNLPFEAPPAPVRACCTGDELEPCVDATFNECLVEHEGNWQFDQLTCSGGFVCPFPGNDFCEDAPFVSEGVQFFDSFGAVIDGPDGETCQDYDASTGTFSDTTTDVEDASDIWYFYQPSESGQALFSTCDNEFYGVEFVHVYTDPSNPAVCPCPSDPGFALSECSVDGLPNHVNANGCTFFGGHSELVLPVTGGNCYTVRLSTSGEKGSLRISLADAICGNNVREDNGGEQCDGTGDTFCPGEDCLDNCLCPPPVCGDGTVSSLLGEDCEPTDDSACPGECFPPGDPLECTCPPECGNNIREPGELCDGTDDSLCPGNCRPAEDPLGECTCITTCGDGVQEVGEDCDQGDDDACPGLCLGDCTCPEPECGNDVIDLAAGEECDGTAENDCVDGLCNPPGDPQSECRCSCGLATVAPPPIAENPDGFDRVRFFTFQVPTNAVAGGTETALRVELTSVASPPGAPSGSQFRYVNSFGGSVICPDAAPAFPDYACAQLGCEPEYRDWMGELGGTILAVTGDAVVPSSTYTVSHIAASCGTVGEGADTCASASAGVAVSTGVFGDIVGPGNGPPDGTANVLDISAAVDKVKGLASAFPEPRVWHKFQIPDPDVAGINVLDISVVIDAVKGLPYPFTIIACP